MTEPGQRQHPAQPESLRVRIDTDDVHLADRLVLVVHLRPVEAGRLTAAFGEEEAFGGEPRLTLAALQVGACPPALLRVVREGARVDPYPGVLVTSDLERAQPYAGRHH